MSLEDFGPPLMATAYRFLQARDMADKAVRARQNVVLIDIFDLLEQEQARQDRLERALAEGHAARERARRRGKGRSRAAQQRRAAHARLADECPTCFDAVCRRAERLRESRRLLAELDRRVDREARAWNERLR